METTYTVSGTLKYTDQGNDVVIPLRPEEINVRPQAELELENTLVVVMLLHFQTVVLVEQGLQELLQEHQLPHVMELLIEVEEGEVQDQVVAVVDQVVQVY